MDCLTIAHNIFITKEERYALASEHCYVVEVVGFSNPVWTSLKKTSEPSEEVFCKYKITNVRNPDLVKMLDDGYQIHINSKKDKQNLLDFKDQGGGSLMMTTHKKMLSPEGKAFFTVHFISINDWDILNNSLTLR